MGRRFAALIFISQPDPALTGGANIFRRSRGSLMRTSTGHVVASLLNGPALGVQNNYFTEV